MKEWCVCMCLCMCTHVWVYIYVCACVHMHVHVCMCVHAYAGTHVVQIESLEVYRVSGSCEHSNMDACSF